MGAEMGEKEMEVLIRFRFQFCFKVQTWSILL